MKEIGEDREKEPAEDPALVLVENAVCKLMEHFETVQILTTKNVNGDTHYYEVGRGNYCARYGQAKLWVKKEERQI